MHVKQDIAVVIILGALMTGCAHVPLGPTVSVFPAPNKPFEVFQQDDATCRHYAGREIAGAAEAANNRAVGAGAVATGLGAVLGAATGEGRGAGAGAAAGAIVGTAVGANISGREQYRIQRRYDISYSQCMYAKGNQVPGFAAPATPPPPPPPRG